MKLSSKSLFAIGLFIIIFGIACNFALGPILKYSGVFEKIPLIFAISGCPFIFIGTHISIICVRNLTLKEDAYEQRIKYDLELGDRFIEKLKQELREEEDYIMPNQRDTFGYLDDFLRFGPCKLYVTEDAPVGSIQKMSACFNMADIRQFTIQDIRSLVIIGGEPTEHMDSLIKLLGAFRKYFNQNSWDYYQLRICTSTTDIDKLVTLTKLEGLITGFIYIPYNMSSLITLLEYTKHLNQLYPKDYTFLDDNIVFLLPEIREFLSDKEIELLGTRWRVRTVRDKREIEMWKGKSIRKLQNFID